MDDITRLYRACAPDEWLPPGDARYVDCDEVRGEDSRIAHDLARDFRRADPAKPEHALFTGHRGVGKSTELHRLIKILASEGPSHQRFHVVFLDLVAELDIGDITLADVLVAIASQTQRSLRDAGLPGFDPITQLLTNVWEGIKQTAKSEVSFDSIEVEGAPGVSITASLKGAPSSRAKLRAAIEQQRVSLHRALNDLLKAARAALISSGKAGLVLIVDGLERVPLDKQDAIFGKGCDQLASLETHALFTIPINQIYGEQFSQISQTFGTVPVPVPMVRLTSGQPDDAGLAKLEEIIAARARFAQVDPAAVFDLPETRQHLCQITGGHPRHLLMFLQAAISRCDALPLTRKAVDYAVRAYTDQLQREIRSEYWQWLRGFSAGPLDCFPDGIPDQIRRELLFYLYVFEYRNGHPFYDINPAVRLLKRFEAKEAAAS